MPVCLYVSMFLCLYVYARVCWYKCMCVCLYPSVFVYLYVCMCTWAHGRPDVCMDAWVRGCMDVGCMDYKTQPLLGNQRPDLPTFLIKMSLLPRLPRAMLLCHSSSKVPRLPYPLSVLHIVVSKCDNSMHIFHIWTPKSVPNPKRF